MQYKCDQINCIKNILFIKIKKRSLFLRYIFKDVLGTWTINTVWKIKNSTNPTWPFPQIQVGILQSMCSWQTSKKCLPSFIIYSTIIKNKLFTCQQWMGQPATLFEPSSCAKKLGLGGMQPSPTNSLAHLSSFAAMLWLGLQLKG